MKVIMTCGGTGGHIYPAIAIADKIKRKNPDADILFIGTQAGMENTLVPESGYPLERIAASGFNRKNIMKNVKTLHDAVKGSMQAKAILERFCPDVVIGTGGYVTGPVIREAYKKNIPVYIHEQNAVPGVANKMLERYAKNVFISFPDSAAYFKDQSKLILSGNPIRKAFILTEITDCREKLGVLPTEFMALIFGGSLGAEVINRETLNMVGILRNQDVKVFFVTGKRYYDQIAADLNKIGNTEFVTIIPYADNMPELLKAADIVVSRAGAIALSEITACGKPSILIPSVNVTNNHQYYNAKSLVDAGAAIMLEEKDLDPAQSVVGNYLIKLKNNKEKLNAMSAASLGIGRVDAVNIIYDHLKI